jgi:hypothetical protein
MESKNRRMIFMNGKSSMGWVWTLLTAILAIVLIYFVVQGVLFVSWAFGGVAAVILAILIITGVLNLGNFVFGIIAIFLLAWLLDFLF